MAYPAQREKDSDMFAHKDRASSVLRDVAVAKPKKLSRAQLERLYKSVTRRIPKTMAILAK